MKSNFVGRWTDLISSASADFIRTERGFHRALRDFIEKHRNLWYTDTNKEECTRIDTSFVSYDEIRQPKHSTRTKEIAVDRANGERYFIDCVSVKQ